MDEPTPTQAAPPAPSEHPQHPQHPQHPVRRPLRTQVVHVLLVVAFVLAIPAVAMQFTDEVNWGAGDVAAGAGLLAGAGVAYVLAARLFHKPLQHVLVGGLLALVVVLVWADLAAGILDA